MKKIVLFVAVALAGLSVQAQSADKVVATYLKNIGGVAKLKQLKGTRMTASMEQQGMQIPLEIIRMKDGKQATIIRFQGMEMKQGVFDGEVLWSNNFQTMSPEKAGADDTASVKADAQNFPNAFVDYQSKGYKVSLEGKEKVDGKDAFKVKLTKKGDDVSYYFFDAETYYPVLIESPMKSGPFKGQNSKVKMSNYKSVDGIFYPFSIVQEAGGQSFPMTVSKIELNPTVDAKTFAFPK